ncbi:adenylate kinase [Pelomyxa schiedti]|nr:adenylate kinase [Pelomyxa schiedti]
MQGAAEEAAVSNSTVASGRDDVIGCGEAEAGAARGLTGTGGATNLVVMGKSGSGKQPRIEALAGLFGLKQVSTGNMFRFYLNKLNVPHEEIKRVLLPLSSEEEVDDIVLGMKAKFFVDCGRYVPDTITNMLFDSLFKKESGRGLILDGYPRTLDQAKHLMDLRNALGTRIDAIILVENSDEIVRARTVGRRICPSCGKVFHIVYKPPKDGKVCPQCGVDVIQRSDDSLEKIDSRLEEYSTKTVPALQYLVNECRIPLYHVPGNLPIVTEEAVLSSVKQSLGL